MNFNQIRIYKPIENIYINPKGYNNKNILFYVLSENCNFFDAYQYMNINPNNVKNVFVPKVKKPFASTLSNSYREKIIDNKLIPKTEIIGGNYSKLIGRNLFFDTTPLITKLENIHDNVKYNSGYGYKFINNSVQWLNGFPDTSFKKVILYIVNIDNFINPKIQKRRIFPIYRNLLLYLNGKIKDIPYDQVLLYYYDYNGGKFALLFDKQNKSTSFNRITNILRSVRTKDDNTELDKQINLSSKEVVEKSYLKDKPDDEKDKFVKIINSYSTSNKHLPSINPLNNNNFILRSILYHTVTSKISLNRLIKKLSKDKIREKKAIDKLSKYIIPKEKVSSISFDKIVKNSKPEELTNYLNPKHILDFRKREFKETMTEDIISIFKTLEKEDIPLKFVSLTVKKSSSSISEIDRSYFDIYKIALKDKKGNIHNVEIQIPTMSDNGTFVLNGMENSLTNQIVTHPIFFFKEYESKFQSSYASFTVKSKQLKNESYYWMFFGNYKFPLFTLLAYKIGFDKTFKLFEVDYKITNEKTEDSIKLPDGRYISFDDKLNQSQLDIIGSFKKALQTVNDDITDITSMETWQDALVNEIGNRSGIYRLDKTWENIVTPIERKVLELKDEPTDIVSIIKYMAENTSTGRVDDRNDLNKQRLRVSELFTAQIQKQVKASYSEYMSKVMAGDENAKYFMDPRKVLSEILVSQNISPMESINPLEELATNTKITPIGIGGLPDTAAFPEKARNIHRSYYGNIDPIETPNSAGVGIQQQLTVNANITNARGMFSDQRREDMPANAVLGTTASMIPFIETNEPSRLIAATGQAKQAFPIKDPENPAIQSGYESILSSLLSDNFIKKSDVSGKVIEVTNELITVLDNKTKKTKSVSIKPIILRSGSGKNGLSIFKSKVNVGDKVKQGDILAEGSNIKNGLISNGVNLITAFMPWKGYNFEDGMVISRSAAEKFVSIHQEDINLVITEEEEITYLVNEGDVLLKGDILASYSETPYDIESLAHKRTNYNGIVNSIEVYSNIKPNSKEDAKEGLHIPEKLRPYYLKFKDYFMKLNGSYPEGSFTKHRKSFNGILIIFTVRQELSMKLGDKVQNRYYNKGVVADIVEDEYMPKLPNGETVEIIYTPITVINRMNPGQLYELHSGLISKELAVQMSKLDKNKFIDLLKRIIDLFDTDKNKKYSKNLIQYLKKTSSKEYNELKDDIIKKRFFPIIVVPFKAPPRTDILKALSILGLKPEYDLKIKLKEENDKVVTAKSIACGVMYIFRLEHISEKKLHSRATGPYQAGTLAPTAGKKREGGVLLGEYDMYGLMAYDAKIMLAESFGSLSTDHITKNEMISEIIREGKTSFRKGKTNPIQSMFVQHMRAMHLRSH
jgi:DNA-directed RNA polymerase beta subunit